MATGIIDALKPETTLNRRTTYKASCHCGAVRFTVALPVPFPEYEINRCNCSVCTKNGYLLVYPTRKDVVFSQGTNISCRLSAFDWKNFSTSFLDVLAPSHFSLNEKEITSTIGYENLANYLFGAKKKPHKFCKTCGTSILIDFKRMEYGETDPEKDNLAVNVSSAALLPYSLSTHVHCLQPLLLSHMSSSLTNKAF